MFVTWVGRRVVRELPGRSRQLYSYDHARRVLNEHRLGGASG